MRIAIFHDFFGTIGGGEKLVLELAKALNADIITTDVNKENLARMDSGDINIISLGKPLKIPLFKQMHAAMMFQFSRFPKYDFYIFSSNWAPFAAKRHQPNLYYCHTPERMFFDLYKDFKEMVPFILRPIFIVWVGIFKQIVLKNLRFVNRIVTNSLNCQKRIKKYYKRQSVVINPPIIKYPDLGYGKFWLSVNRIYPHKRLDLQIGVFRRLPNEKLVIVGGATRGDHSMNYFKKIMKKLPANVVYTGEVTETQLVELYGKCKGFIATSVDEDFGMAPIEAMSAGKPVVAVNIGGFKESIIEGKTGYLVNSDVESLLKAVKKVSKDPSKFNKACKKRAKDFSVSVFIRKMKHEISKAEK